MTNGTSLASARSHAAATSLRALDAYAVEAEQLRELRRTPARTHDAVDAIARVGEDAADVPGLEALEQMIGDGVGHARGLRMIGSCGGENGNSRIHCFTAPLHRLS